jgi:E3 ubiquitin-protein ligase UBR4
VALLYGEHCRAAHAEVALAERRRREIQASLADFAASHRSAQEESDDDRDHDWSAALADRSGLGVAAATLLPLTPLLPPTSNFGCSAAFVAQVLPICAALVAWDCLHTSPSPTSLMIQSQPLCASMVRCGLPSALLAGGLAALGPPSVRTAARSLIAALVAASPSHATSQEVCDGIERRVRWALTGRVAHAHAPGTLSALADDCRLLAKLAQAIHLDDNADVLDDVDAKGASGDESGGGDDDAGDDVSLIAATTGSRASSGGDAAAPNVDASLAEHLELLAGLDVDHSSSSGSGGRGEVLAGAHTEMHSGSHMESHMGHTDDGGSRSNRATRAPLPPTRQVYPPLKSQILNHHTLNPVPLASS